MDSNQRRNTSLPVWGKLGFWYAISFIIGERMVVASIARLLRPWTRYPADELLQSFLPTAVSILFIGSPLLLASIWLTRRDKLIGLLYMPGALLFALYTYIIYVFAIPFRAIFLVHLRLITLSGYTHIGLLGSIESEAVKHRLVGVVPGRLAGSLKVGSA